MSCVNEYDQPVGEPVNNWTVRPRPSDIVLSGRTCHLEPLSASKHAHQLYAAYSQAPDGRDWTYMPFGPFTSFEEYRKHAEVLEKSEDPKHFTVISTSSGEAVGTLSLMRINPENGVIEVGYITFSPLLKRSALSTEAQYILMAYVFDQLGYRRYEWKCDSLNEPSRKAADRLGFRFEGIFYHNVVYKGRNRDTAWYAITSDQWPALKSAFEAWLLPENFDEHGQQIKALKDFREK